MTNPRFRLFLSLLIALSVSQVCAYDAKVDGIYYNLDEDTHEATITYYNSYIKGSSMVYTPWCSGSLTLPEKITYEDEDYSVTSIGQFAFCNCKELTAIDIPGSIKSIESHSFYQCTALENVMFHEGLETIDGYAFSSCSSLKSVILPASVNNMYGNPFAYCSSLEEVMVKDGNKEFSSPAGSNAILVPDFPETGYILVVGCKNTVVPDEVTEIGSYAFNSCTGLSTIELPESVWKIDSYAFSGCTGLTSVKMHEGISTIGYYAFSNCKSLQQITLPMSLHSIGERAFANCESMSSIELPEDLKELSSSVFYGTPLEKITSLAVEPATAKEDAFEGVESAILLVPAGTKDTYREATGWNALSSIIEADDNGDPLWTEGDAFIAKTEEGVSMSFVVTDAAEKTCTVGQARNKSAIYNYTQGVVTVPSVVNGFDVTGIGNYAFDECRRLTTINLPYGIKTIGDVAFSSCNQLIKINIPRSVKSIGGWTFYWCTNLARVEIPNGVESIGQRSFYQMNSLTTVVLPISMKSIGTLAFYGSKKLKTIKVYMTDTISINTNVFEGISADATLYVPKGCKERYAQSAGWSVIPNIEEFDDAAENLPAAERYPELADAINEVGEMAAQCSRRIAQLDHRNASVRSETVAERLNAVREYEFDGPKQTELSQLIEQLFASNDSRENIENQLVVQKQHITAVLDELASINELLTKLEEEIKREKEIRALETDISQLDNIIYIDRVLATSGSQMKLSVKMKNSALIRGFQFNMYLPEGVTVVKNSKGKIQASLSKGRLPEDDEHTLTVQEQTDGSVMFLCGSMYNENFTANDGEIITLPVDIAGDLDDGNYVIRLKDIKLTETDITTSYNTELIQSVLVLSATAFSPGDINGDGKVDVSDYIGIANHIVGNTPEGFIEKTADVDGNGAIDVSDYIGVANIILTGSVKGE